MKYDQYEYIRNYYRVPIRKDAPIRYKGKPGKVTGVSNSHAKILLDGENIARPYHPRDEDLEWLGEQSVNVVTTPPTN